MRARAAAFLVAVHDEMQHGVEAGGLHVGMGSEVPGGVEVEAGAPCLSPATADEVARRILAAMGDIGVVGGVPDGVEDAAIRQRLEFLGLLLVQMRVGHQCSSRASNPSR